MLGRLQEGIALEAVRSFLPATQASPHSIQPVAQALEQMINRLQGKGQTCRLRRGLDSGFGQQLDQQLPHNGGVEGVPRQHLRPKNGEGAPAAAAPAAIGAKDSLSPSGLAIGLGGIVAEKKAVPI